MPSVNCTVNGGGGWNPIGAAFPANQNDGDNGTYQGWPGDVAGSDDATFDDSPVPSGATISDVTVSSLWGAGSAPATVAVSAILGAATVALGIVNDVSNFNFSIPRPGGGLWTKADIAGLRVRVSSLQTGNGNFMRRKSTVLIVTYILGGTFCVAMIDR